MTATTTESTELVGGPSDGHTHPLVRPVGTDMPQLHPAHERYQLVAVDDIQRPRRWRYRWVPHRPARARPACDRHTPPRPGCPGYRAETSTT